MIWGLTLLSSDSVVGGKQCRFASQSFCHSAIIKGATVLSAREISIPDLRAGFAYVMAALIANETSTITGLPFLDRGYEKLVPKLLTLGVEVERVKRDDKPEITIGGPSRKKKGVFEELEPIAAGRS